MAWAWIRGSLAIFSFLFFFFSLSGAIYILLVYLGKCLIWKGGVIYTCRVHGLCLIWEGFAVYIFLVYMDCASFGRGLFSLFYCLSYFFF